jgi:BirA family transcriptional regulator, biotin operon repressor / biotin---[acetyl-CoA-carboxylase] ligase
MTTDSLPRDEGRRLLDAARLNGALAPRPGLWREVRVVEETGSTNADLLAEARAGAGEGLVLVAEAQTAGRGRMGRRWISPPRRALTFSVLLRPAVPAGLLGWLPLLAGVAVASALEQTAGVDARLKWPNDVLADDAKIAGILAERSGSAIVVGTGINVLQHRGELPLPTATSLLMARRAGPAEARGPGPSEAPGPSAGADMRERLLIAVLDELARWYQAWVDQPHPGDAGGCGLRGEYLRRSATVGAPVTVTLPSDQNLTGTAAGIDATGRLEIRTPAGLVQVSAGDVVHLRGAMHPAAG